MDKNTVIGFVLIFLILILSPYFLPTKQEEKVKETKKKEYPSER